MKSSERAEFDAFVVGVWGRLFRTAYALNGNQHDAEDILQTAFAKAYSKWRRISRTDSPEAYVHRMIANETISAWRRRWRQVERSTDTLPERPAGTGHDDTIADRTAMWAAIQRLPPRQRAVVVLRYYEDLSEQEIADTLGISPGTVKSQASHALKALRGHLDSARQSENVDGRLL